MECQLVAVIEDELAKSWDIRIKRKSNKTGNLKTRPGKVNRVAGAAPEVMVKITGYGKGAAHVKEHMNYISRNGKVEVEDENGDLYRGREEIGAKFKTWERDLGRSKDRAGQRDTMHIVLSMPEGTEAKDVKIASREFAKETFSKNYSYVMALHEDTKQPHVHLTVKTLGHDNKRLHADPEDIQEWRERFAEKMRERGIDAEATPRPVRGVVRKPEKNVIRHIEQGDKTHKPRVSKVRASKIKEAVNEIEAESKGLPLPNRPWEKKIRDTQERVRAAWMNAAAKLENTATEEAKKFAERIKAFVEKMPPIETERDLLKNQLKRKAINERQRRPEEQQQSENESEKKGVDATTPDREDDLER